MIRSVRLLALVPLLAAGCGGGKGDLTGKITFGGKPLPKGQVSLQARDGKMYAADIQPDGSYTITGIPSGSVKIAVTCIDESVTEYYRALAQAGKGNAPAPKEPPKPTYAIPDKYNDFNSSGLTAEVKSGSTPTTFNIDIPTK